MRWAFLVGDGYPVACPAGQGRPACLAATAARHAHGPRAVGAARGGDGIITE
ncbi:MAG: hypothetical protein LBE08_09430 [Bifidobacteriaceae bacterium]|nr:hypothetical protein [Bifidobacteriaceae bacterium]